LLTVFFTTKVFQMLMKKALQTEANTARWL